MPFPNTHSPLIRDGWHRAPSASTSWNRKPEIAARPGKPSGKRRTLARAVAARTGHRQQVGHEPRPPTPGILEAAAEPNRSYSKDPERDVDICDYLDAVALLDKALHCSIIQPDPESGAAGHPLVQDTGP